MLNFIPALPTLAVFPVLVGPLQTLLALLPAILLGLGSMLFAAFKPAGFVNLVRFCWRQKLFFGCVAAVIAGWQYGVFAKLFETRRSASESATTDGTNWSTSGGGPLRLGRGPGELDPTTSAAVWKNDRDETVFSSPAVSGSRVFFATATGMGPFSPEGRGAIVCVEAETGREVWRYAPNDYRATFSSPVVADGCVVCGEGLHQVKNARVTCLDLLGHKRWEFQTESHVEATAAIADGKVFIGAGADGFYCLALEPAADGQPRVLWHLDAEKYPDCESSPAVSEGVVYFGLGDGGSAVCAVDALTGTERWRIETPYPVFAPPTVADGKLYLATGNGNYVQSAADLLEMKLQMLKDEGATEPQLAAARERLQPAGEVWCIDLVTQQVDWKFAARDAILGDIVRGDDSLYFGSRDGHLYRVSLGGQLLEKHDLREPLVCSPALGRKHVYATTSTGRLFCLDARTLKPVWDASLGGGETFVSSPVVAHGHVYVGTAQQGLRCLGQPGDPEPPLWSRGERGGRADDEPIPQSLSLAWQYPSVNELPFEVTAPLMPFDGAIYAAGVREGRTELFKLSGDIADSSAPRLLWSHPFDSSPSAGSIQVAPVACGNRVCVAEIAEPLEGNGRLWCLSADDGRTLWKQPLDGDSAGLAIDAKQVIAWSGPDRLQSFNLTNGKPVWKTDLTGSQAVGAPTIAHGLVFAATETHLVALDAPTGVLLWTVPIRSLPTAGPFVERWDVILPHVDRHALHSLLDGRFCSDRPAARESDAWPIPDGLGQPVTPKISLRQRVYFGTSDGAVVCLSHNSSE
ncbi:MAG: PQQ-binding-like beta-propeller repeat protein [Planctomycetaceae bacterium]